ncbi:MAG: dTDP-4-dehydrorhamnose reductase [candidate division Zixibacteria bacterium RBG_16_40_9]|nr:MAG: dTDP-4-dehydrorhamnose reductase [candidate division Zixibacteria bacterium RBG_16_40_9]
MKKILITGANGLLGQKLVVDFSKWNSVLATGKQNRFAIKDKQFFYQTLDITDKKQVQTVIGDFRPELIINAAAFMAVDACEEQKELAWEVNVEGVKNLLEESLKYEIKFLQISTDYIFDGKNGPYSEEDRPNPVNYYGGTKLQAEEILQDSEIQYLIIRSNVIYGKATKMKKNFFLWVYENLRQKKQIKVVTDQFNNPTLADNLSILILEATERNLTGILNLAGTEYLSRYDFAFKIADYFDLNRDLIKPVTTPELEQKAARPLRGGLKIDKAQKILSTPFFSVTEGLEFLKKKIRDDSA